MNPTIKNHNEKIIGYKAFKKDEKGIYTDGNGNTKKHYFEVGKEYEIDCEPILCKQGFHFFRHYCFAIDYFETGNAIYKVESIGDVQEDTEKCVTNKIKILDFIYEELDQKNNSGDENSGDRNSGSRNSGDENSGNWNSGIWNSGDENSGNWNSGDENSGNWNSGSRNSGDENSGSRNSGNWNSGDENSGNWNSGNGYRNYFCTETKYFLFDIEVKEIPEKLKYIDFNWFILEEKGIKGYKKAWSKCPKEILKQFKSIPEFKTKEAKKKFFEITGINI